jgi:hypothetical protein
MVTFVTVSIGSYLSRGAQVSRFGHKLPGPNIEFGKKVAEMSGTGQVIARHIVNPVLKAGANHLGRYVGKKVQESYKSYKESGYHERFKEVKLACMSMFVRF